MAIETVRRSRRSSPGDASGAASGSSRSRVLGRDWPVAYLFIAPLVLLLFGLIAYPLVRGRRSSASTTYTGVTNRGCVGLQNYERLWENRQFRDSVWITVKYATIAVFFKFWIGLIAAPAAAPEGLRFRSVFTGLVLLPWIIPDVVAALTWRGIYDPDLRRPEPAAAQAGPDRQGHRLAGRLRPGAALGDRRQRLEGHPLLHHRPPGRPEGDRQRALRRRRGRRRQRLAPLRRHHPARPALRDHRRLPALADLDAQRLRPGLPADRRRAGRRHPPLLDPVLRVRDRRLALQRRRRGRDVGRARRC